MFKPGDRVLVIINGEQHSGIIDSVDQGIGMYTVQMMDGSYVTVEYDKIIGG